jgi:hypothetical protein
VVEGPSDKVAVSAATDSQVRATADDILPAASQDAGDHRCYMSMATIAPAYYGTHPAAVDLLPDASQAPAQATQTASHLVQVFVLRGAAHAMDVNTIDAIRHAAFGVRRGRQLRGIIVFMDPDDAGRRGAAIPPFEICCQPVPLGRVRFPSQPASHHG